VGSYMLGAKIYINREMTAARADLVRAACMEIKMTEVQREVFLFIDEY